MVKLQLDIPDNIERELAIYSVKENLRDKRKAILNILQEHFKIKSPIKVE